MNRPILTPPPSYIYRRNQMRRTSAEVIMCAMLMFALVWMTISPDAMPTDAEYQSQ